MHCCNINSSKGGSKQSQQRKQSNQQLLISCYQWKQQICSFIKVSKDTLIHFLVGDEVDENMLLITLGDPPLVA